jgi:hypothetical protein
MSRSKKEIIESYLIPEHVENETLDLELPDDAYNDEMLEEMKLAGLPKPVNVTLARWQGKGDESINHRYNLLVNLAVLGTSIPEIASQIGYAPQTVTKVLDRPEIKARVKDLQDKHFGKNLRKRIELIATKATDVIEDVLDNPQEQTKHRLDAAKYMLDQSIGKAQQQLEVKGNMLQEVLIKLEQQERSLNTTHRNLLDKPRDHMDDFIDAELGEPIVVGKRNREQQEEPNRTTGPDNTEQDS